MTDERLVESVIDAATAVERRGGAAADVAEYVVSRTARQIVDNGPAFAGLHRAADRLRERILADKLNAMTDWGRRHLRTKGR